jgi:hypothetical protein
MICIICGLETDDPGGFARHVSICANAPSPSALVDEYNAGASIEELARRHGMSRPTMHNRLRRCNRFRPRGTGSIKGKRQGPQGPTCSRCDILLNPAEIRIGECLCDVCSGRTQKHIPSRSAVECYEQVAYRLESAVSLPWGD